MMTARKSLAFAGMLVAAGCNKEAPAAQPAAKLPALTLTGGKASHDAANAAPAALRGTVSERLDAPNYTYLRLTHAKGEAWAAVPTSSIAVGAEVTLLNPMPMEKFESKTLGRTFDVVLFGTLAAEADANLSRGAANPHGGMGGAPAVAAEPAGSAINLASIKVAKAGGADGRSIAEVYAQRAELKDRSVAVRARVVKVTSGVLGKNWVHLRDGTGSDATQDNDLIVATDDSAQIGDEVTVVGLVHLDRDLGAGYVYKLLIENAKLAK